MHSSLTFILNSVLMILLSNSIFGQLTAEDELLVQSFMDEHHIPGLSIAMADNSGIIYATGFGLKNAGDTLNKVDQNTAFQAASISKCLTAVLCLQIKTINLDDLITDYLSTWTFVPYKNNPAYIPTVRQLLNHTGGINVHGFKGYRKDDKIPTLDEILNGAQKKGKHPKIKALKVPGNQFMYSGGGYTILQKALVDQFETPFNTLMSSSIFGPCKMQFSYFGPANDEENTISFGHDKKGKSISGGFNNYPELAAAGLWSTPTDLILFLRGIQHALNETDTTLLSHKNALELIDFSTLNNGSKIWYGLGFFLTTDKTSSDLIAFSHGGNNRGYTSFIQGHCSNGKSLAIMCNRDNVDLSPIIKLIQDRLGFKQI